MAAFSSQKYPFLSEEYVTFHVRTRSTAGAKLSHISSQMPRVLRISILRSHLISTCSFIPFVQHLMCRHITIIKNHSLVSSRPRRHSLPLRNSSSVSVAIVSASSSHCSFRPSTCRRLLRSCPAGRGSCSCHAARFQTRDLGRSY
jgi:hypothetical protein